MPILLVEDFPELRQTIAEYLKDTGLQVWEADNGKDALTKLCDPARQITVLVTDLDLGPGDNGLVLAAKAKRLLPHLQVIYETGSPEMLFGRSMADWEKVFLKPFDIRALSEAVFAADRQVSRRQRCRVTLPASVLAPGP